MIKHVSFDVWNTLIVPNPYYAQARTQLLAEQFNLEPERVKRVYTFVKQTIDRNAEVAGAGPTTYEVFEALIRRLNTERNVQWELYHIQDYSVPLRNTMERLFMMYPPHVTESARMVFELLRDMDISISIGSNSNFISGHVMHPYLQNVLGRIREISYGVYSDLEGASKPSYGFFETIHLKGNGHGKVHAIGKDQYLHVGDSQVCDVVGAKMYGFNAVRVTDPHLLYSTVAQTIHSLK